VAIDPVSGLKPYHARKIAFGLGLTGTQVGSCVKFLTAMYAAFIGLDASIVEINPLVVTGKGDVIALDAKMNFDDNGLFRHKEVEELRDADEEDPLELEAGKHELNYITLDGSIGCMVNGAGLAMATMTSSSSMAARRPTSSMSAAAPPRSASRSRSRSSCRTRTSKHPDQHLRRYHALRR